MGDLPLSQLWTECLGPPKVHTLRSYPTKWWCWEVGVSGRWLYLEGGDFMNEFSALITKAPESPLISSTMWRHNEKIAIFLRPRKQDLTRHQIWCFDLELPKQGFGDIWEINFCSLKATLCMVFCYSNPNGLRYSRGLFLCSASFLLLSDKLTLDLFLFYICPLAESMFSLISMRNAFVVHNLFFFSLGLNILLE